jgi:hypothetical protein
MAFMMMILKCESFSVDGGMEWSTHDFVGIPWARVAEFHLDWIMRCAHQFIFSSHVQDLTISLVIQRGEMKNRSSSSLGYDMFPFDKSLMHELELCVDWILGIIRVVQRKSVGVVMDGLPIGSCVLGRDYLMGVWIHEDDHCSIRNQHDEADIQGCDLGVLLVDCWLHILIGYGDDRSFGLIQRLLVGVLVRIIWDPGGVDFSLLLRLLEDKQFQGGWTVMSPFL